MLPWESRRDRRKGRARRRPDLAVLERLEGRELMAYTPLGYSLPDLTIQGFTAPAASWGQALTVTVNVKNTGASTLIEPLALQVGATSTADAPPTQVVIYASPQRRNGARRPVPIGIFDIPSIPQNDVEQFTGTVVLPSRPRGFAREGGTINLSFQVDPARNIVESDYTNNISRKVPVLISAPRPQIAAVGIDLPPIMQPGDTVNPNIRVANFGPVDTGPVTVSLVASVDREFGPGSSVIATYTVGNISGINTAASQNQGFDNATATIDPPNNVATITGEPVTLPVTPRNYYVGVVVDPTNSIPQLGRIGRHKVRPSVFSLIQKVGPPISGLPPAGVVFADAAVTNRPFPFPINGAEKIGTPTSPTPPITFE